MGGTRIGSGHTAVSPRPFVESARGGSGAPVGGNKDGGGGGGGTRVRDGFDGGRVTLASSPAARSAAIDDFTRSMHPPPTRDERERMDRALESFGDDQLTRMREGGVRFMRQRDGLPDDLVAAGAVAPGVSSPAGYLAEARVLRFGESTSPATWRHELGHAWDDVRGETRNGRFDDMPLRQRTRLLTTLDREVSRDRAFGSSRDARLTDAFEDYRGSRRWTSDARSREAFDIGAREGYSLRSVEEFYAEGFSAFHGDREHAARIERNAPGLYRRLAEEARDAGTLPAWVDPATLSVRPE
ncbi:MAG: hypothetical protein JNK82_02915 [Myxococcaceae bacterium]|nr:hypothetical protein [Myxococcaceae bacterium]